MHAAAPCPVPVKEQIIEWWGPIVHEYYSATEGIGLRPSPREDWLAHKGSVGRVHRLDDPHLSTTTAAEVPVGEVGVVWFEHPVQGLQFEYHNDPDKTAGQPTTSGAGDPRRHRPASTRTATST